jgi:PAS domain S-box-containing protein
MSHGSTGSFRVLHIDDDPDFSDLTARFLEREIDNIRVMTETSATAGLNRISSETDCIISDYDMPGVNGIEFLERIREKYPKLPVILFTGKGSEEVASEAMTAEATDYLQKDTGPEQYELLANRIQNAVGKYRSEQAEQRRRERQTRQRDALAELTTDTAIVAGEFKTAAERLTETAADVIVADCVSVWLFTDDRTTLTAVDIYDRRTDNHDSGVELQSEAYPEYFEAIETHRIINAADAHSDPRMSGIADEYFSDIDVVSVLDAVLHAEGEVIGVLRHTHTGGIRQWADDEIQFAGDMADLVHRAYRNKQQAADRREMAFQQSLLEAREDAMLDGLLIVNRDGEILSYNEQLVEMWSIPRSATEADDSEQLFEHMQNQIDDYDAFEAVFQTDEDTTQSGELPCAGGHVYDYYTTPVIGEDGTQYGRLWSFRDVTEDKERKQELEAQTRAMDEAPISITISDPSQDDNPLIYANTKFEQLTGYDEEEAIGENCRFMQGEETRPEPVEELRTAVERGEPATVEIRNYRKGGTEFWNRLSIAPIRDSDGELVNFIGFQLDITERKERERRLKRENERLDQFATIISHDIRNPLQVARGQLEYAQETGNQESFEKAYNALDRIEDIIQDVLTLARQGQAVEQTVTTDLNEVAIDAWQNVSTEDMSLSVIGESTIQADPGRLQELFENLFRNSLEHAKPPVSVTVGTLDTMLTTTRSENDDLNGFYVSDDGPGIPEDERDDVLESGYTTAQDGTGFGLAIVKQIAEAHRWDITVTEGHDGGARFDFLF